MMKYAWAFVAGLGLSLGLLTFITWWWLSHDRDWIFE